MMFTKDSVDFDRYCRVYNSNMVCLHEVKGTFIKVNEASLEITGYSPEELCGTNPYDYYHPDDREFIQRTGHMPALEGLEGTATEYRFRRKDGHYIWLFTETKPVTDENGMVCYLLTISQNITNEIMLRDELLQKENLFDQIGQLAQIGAWEVDIDTMSPQWSKVIYDICEVNYDYELDLAASVNFFAEESREALREAFNNAITKGVSYDLTLSFVTAKEKKIWVRTIGRPLIRFGKTVKLYGVFQNVTQDVEVRNNLKRLVEQLTMQNTQLEALLQSLPIMG